MKPEKYVTPTMLSLKQPATLLWGQLNPANIAEVFASPNKGLAGIRKELAQTEGEAYAAAYVQGLVNIAIIDLCESLNLGDTGRMTPEQIKSAAQLIAQEYYFLKPDDFKYCFNLAKLGRFGKVFNRLDVGVISDFLNQYCSMRSEAAERISYGDHNTFRMKERKPSPDEEQITRQEFYARGKRMQAAMKEQEEKENTEKEAERQKQLSKEVEFMNLKQNYQPEYVVTDPHAPKQILKTENNQ